MVSCALPQWAAVIKWIRIGIVLSPMSYQLILSVPESHHEKAGALSVGNPCLGELKGDWVDFPGAQKEVESIELILNTIPLIRRQGTKAEVMKLMSSVDVIHIAAHADENTGEIFLSPNLGWTSRFLLENVRRTSD